jgi:hypothetical protein
MIILSSTSDKIQVTTSAVGTVDVHSTWADNAAGTVTPGRTNTPTITTATTTDVVASPTGTNQRALKSLSIRNRHASSANTITVIHTDGTNALELIKCTLNAGEEICWYDNVGFVIYTASGAIKTGLDQAAVAITGGTITGVFLTLAAGTTALAPLTLTAGTNLTSPPAGAWEYDGKVSYFSHVASARGVNDTEQFVALTATYTLSNISTVQKLFNVPCQWCADRSSCDFIFLRMSIFSFVHVGNVWQLEI